MSLKLVSSRSVWDIYTDTVSKKQKQNQLCAPNCWLLVKLRVVRTHLGMSSNVKIQHRFPQLRKGRINQINSEALDSMETRPQGLHSKALSRLMLQPHAVVTPKP